MKRIICTFVFVIASLIATAQNITPEMGLRLTRWTNSKDSREALVYQVLRDIYPNEPFNTLMRKADSFSSNPKDAGDVFVGIYNSLGADYAYASLRDGFSRQQMVAIDNYFTANGGEIKRVRSESDRKQNSAAAAKRGINKDIALRLMNFVDRYSNMQYIVASVLSEKGINDMGIYRVIDSFDENLDYVEEVILAIYDRYGSAEGAYGDLRLFLTVPQIEIMDSIYANRIEEKRRIKEQEIDAFKKTVYAGEPYNLDAGRQKDYANKALRVIDGIVKSIDNKEYSISVKDSIFAFRNPHKYTHKLSLSLPADLEFLRNKITNGINEIPIDLLPVIDNRLSVSCQAESKGYYECTYSLHQESASYEVYNKKLKPAEKEELEKQLKEEYWKETHLGPYNHYVMASVQVDVPNSVAVLIKGDEEEFNSVKDEVAAFLHDAKLYGKRKVKVIKTIRNGDVEDIQVILLDKKTVIE